MKTFMVTFFCIVSMAFTAYAGDQLPVVSGVSYVKVETNFDGSKTIIEPRVRVAGKDVRVDERSGWGFCKILNLSFVSVNVDLFSDRSKSKSAVAYVNSQGFFFEYAKDSGYSASEGYLISYDYSYASQITCR